MHTIFAAGLFNSDEHHWQRKWYDTTEDAHWVEQSDWNNPVRDAWVDRLRETITPLEGPKMLVAHSLGCNTIVEWAAQYPDECKDIVGALLVAFPDAARPDTPPMIKGYKSPPLVPLPFRSIAAISSNDPYCQIDSGRNYAKAWGCETFEVGDLGHINSDSQLGDWPQGKDLLNRLYPSSV